MTVMFAVGFVAFTKRASHQMGRHAAVQLSFAAGLLWPLLAVAAMQAMALLILKAALGSVRSLGSSAAESVEAPAASNLTPAVSNLTPAPVAAAA